MFAILYLFTNLVTYCLRLFTVQDIIGASHALMWNVEQQRDFQYYFYDTWPNEADINTYEHYIIIYLFLKRIRGFVRRL